jgi:hypothetical protein
VIKPHTAVGLIPTVCKTMGAARLYSLRVEAAGQDMQRLEQVIATEY